MAWIIIFIGELVPTCLSSLIEFWSLISYSRPKGGQTTVLLQQKICEWIWGFWEYEALLLILSVGPTDLVLCMGTWGICQQNTLQKFTIKHQPCWLVFDSELLQSSAGKSPRCPWRTSLVWVFHPIFFQFHGPQGPVGESSSIHTQLFVNHIKTACNTSWCDLVKV